MTDNTKCQLTNSDRFFIIGCFEVLRQAGLIEDSDKLNDLQNKLVEKICEDLD